MRTRGATNRCTLQYEALYCQDIFCLFPKNIKSPPFQEVTVNGIRKSLLQLVFSGSYMLRWNDKLRPAPLWEIDKQGHKMILAFVLWHENSRRLAPAQRRRLAREVIEGGLFDYLYRLIITDLKPPIFYRIKNNPDHFRQMTTFVLHKLEPSVRPLGEGFWQRMEDWFAGKRTAQAEDILNAAHWFTSRWEFNLLKEMNRAFDDEIKDIEQNFDAKMAACAALPGMADIQNDAHALGKFANLCGQLRFQIRWTQAPRIPATSVLGHMFLVAIYAYFASLTVNACTARCNNNFFCGLLHDLPELLTRDVISPVKHSVNDLADILRQYEEEELERRILGPLRAADKGSLVDDMAYLLGLGTGSEFDDTIRQPDGKAQKLDNFTVLHAEYDADGNDPKDGQLIKGCDLLAAFMEAHSSIRNGVASPHLQDAVVRLRHDIHKKSVPELHFASLLADFD